MNRISVAASFRILRGSQINRLIKNQEAKGILKIVHQKHKDTSVYLLKLAGIAVFAVSLTTLMLRSEASRAESDKEPIATLENLVGDSEPELAPIPYTRVGVGQRIAFGLGPIDEEGDEVRVELIKKPASAKYNENTLTVDWRPSSRDGRNGEFVVRLTEYDRATCQPRRTFDKSFSIAIEPRPVQLLGVPVGPMAVESLVTVSDPARLGAVNARWPIVSLLDRIAEIEASKQIKPGSDLRSTNGTALFRDALRNLALLHHNNEIDPDSPNFNPQWKAEHWQLITVRPRVNKKIFELRLVYRNILAPEPVYLMPRMRIVRAKDSEISNDLRQKNNKAFATSLHDAFFDGPDLKPFVTRDKMRYAKALSDFVTKILTYDDSTDPNMKANFAALPHNARLGGGNRYDEKGKYIAGDGWALGTMKVQPIEINGQRRLGFTSPMIDGFTTSIKPNQEGTGYKSFPSPRFDPNSAGFVSGWNKLIHDQGFVGIADDDHDPPNASNIDALIFSHKYRFKYMVQETPLRDPRRRLFEERGMTCIQCHTRNFDEGDFLNKAVSDPNLGPNYGMTRDVPRVFFVIVPTPDEGRSEYFRRVELEQTGSLTGVMRDFLGIKVKIESPLASDWPHDTRSGKH
jgi:hypothetical protein